MARDLIAIVADVPKDSFDVELTVAVGSAQAALDEALAARSEAEASRACRAGVHQGRGAGATTGRDASCATSASCSA